MASKSNVSKEKYEMKMSLNVLNHLGLNLYSNIPAVLSEVVANAYDADATLVKIVLKASTIEIEDNGHGMTLEDINEKFLHVGYQRRENGEAKSPRFKREVMGRKGIGKLSLFSIANNIDVYSVRKNPHSGKLEKNGLNLNKFDIERDIKSKNGIYHPKDISVDKFNLDSGTRIVLSDFKKAINHSGPFLRKRLAKRFTVLGSKYNFDIEINSDKITYKDRDFFGKVQFLWLIGDQENNFNYDFAKVEKLNGKFDDGTNFSIRGWIGTVEFPSDLDHEGSNNNKISIICRGKMAQEDILESFNEGGLYSAYLIGEIHADFLDIDSDEDIATSSRQKINEEDPRYRRLQEHVYKMLKSIQGKWSQYRTQINEKVAVDHASSIHPGLKEWYDNLKTDARKEHAKKLFTTIQSFHFDPKEPNYKEKKKELYVQGIIAFEKLKLKESLEELSKIKTADDIRLSNIFIDLNDLEANLYYDIAAERVEVIKKFQEKLDANDKERILQTYLFDNLWILNPSWERPTTGSEIMEKTIEKAFKSVITNLTKEEKKGRLDIKYRTSAGKHIVIELKRYKPTYPLTPVKLYEQMKKYRSAVTKALATVPSQSGPIELIAIIGQRFIEEDFKEAERLLNGINARFIYYDDLIQQSLNAYSDYLDKQKEVSKLRKIIDKLIIK